MRISFSPVGVLLASSFLWCGAAATAEEFDVEVTLSVASDFQWRGISLTNQSPAATGSVTVSASGYYLGGFIGNYEGFASLDDPGADVTGMLYAGFSRYIGNTGFSFGAEGSLTYLTGDARRNLISIGSYGEDGNFVSAQAEIDYALGDLVLSVRGIYDRYIEEYEAVGGIERTTDAIYGVARAQYTLLGIFNLGADVGRYFIKNGGTDAYDHYSITVSYDTGIGVEIGGRWYANTITQNLERTLRLQDATGAKGAFVFFVSSTTSRN